MIDGASQRPWGLVIVTQVKDQGHPRIRFDSKKVSEKDADPT